jgi:hypothetical protein
VNEAQESKVLCREIGRLVGPIIGLGARWAARRLPSIAAESHWHAAVPMQELLTASLRVLKELKAKPLTSVIATELISIVGSGTMNMNPTIIRVQIESNNTGMTIRVRTIAKEGAIQQDSAKLAMNKFIGSLQAKLPNNALQATCDAAST